MYPSLPNSATYGAEVPWDQTAQSNLPQYQYQQTNQGLNLRSEPLASGGNYNPYQEIYTTSFPYNQPTEMLSQQPFTDYSHGYQRTVESNAPSYTELDSGGVIAYQGGGEPYGAQGFSDYVHDQPESYGKGKSSPGAKPTPPPAPGAQRFGAKLLPDSGSSEGFKNIICQIALDGIRLLDPKDGKTLRIYPLDCITSWAVKDGNIFTFWTRTSSDRNQKVVKLQASEYTVNNILDALTAACVQLSEILAKPQPQTGPDGDSNTKSEKSGGPGPGGLLNWIGKKQEEKVEKDHWVPDDAASKCSSCKSDFHAFNRKHHCRNCGGIFCDKCSQGRTSLTSESGAPQVRVCDPCLAEVTQRLANSAEAAQVKKPVSHEDLARQLQEEMDRKATVLASRAESAKSATSWQSSGPNEVKTCGRCSTVFVGGSNSTCPSCGQNEFSSKQKNNSDNSGNKRVVACPTCTVHLEVEIPQQGTETVECGVCGSPFLVSA